MSFPPIISKRVVAVGDSYDAVFAESRQKYPDEMPYLVFIPHPADDMLPAPDSTVSGA
jgi:hypothetical protein